MSQYRKEQGAPAVGAAAPSAAAPSAAAPGAVGLGEIPGARPLTARSVVASVLLGSHPPRLPTRSLVRAGQLFGIAEGTVRVAVSRMLAAGELEADDGRYALSGRLLARQERQDTSRHPRTRAWHGSWLMAVVVRERRAAAERAELRQAMVALRLAELREGTWLRPDNLDPRRLPDARRVVDGQCQWFGGAPQGDPRATAASLWDLRSWHAGAQKLLAAMDRLAGAVSTGDPGALGTGFVLSAAVLRHLLADPLLPQELLPRGWAGPALRDTYDSYDKVFRRTLRQWLNIG